MYKLILIGCFVLPITAFSQQYSHGNPTDEEQQMLEMINRARMDPTAEGIRLMDTDDQQVQQAYTAWQIDKAKTKTAFSGYPTRPPLAFHPALIEAARLHSDDMVANNFQGHTGSNGSQLNNRLAAQGYVSQGQYGENVAAYANSVWYGHCGFNVDWGPQNQIDLGHRSNIMNFSDAVYTEIGVGVKHTTGGIMQGTVGPLVVTEDFGIRSVRYITGVAYDDKNHNGFYDIGEGLEGVKVQPSRGGSWAVTSASGGYAIPFSGNGSVVVTASGGPLSDPIVINTSFEGENLKVDFIPASQAPGVVSLVSPANNATNVAPNNVTLAWKAAAFTESYEIQVANSSAFGPSSILMQLTSGTTSVSLTALPCGQLTYWRVRGVNTLGTGTWSTPYAFTTSGTAAGTTSLIGPKGAVTVDNMGAMTCTWNAATAAAVYHVRFSTNTSFTNIFAEDSTVTTTSFSLPVSAIPPGTQVLYWSARAGNDCGWGPWSGFGIVTPTITSVEETAASMTTLRIAPNPVSTTSTIQIVGDVLPGSFMTVVGLTGNVITTRPVEGSASSMTIESLVGKDLASGTYSVILIQPNGVSTRTTFVVVR